VTASLKGRMEMRPQSPGKRTLPETRTWRWSPPTRNVSAASRYPPSSLPRTAHAVVPLWYKEEGPKGIGHGPLDLEEHEPGRHVRPCGPRIPPLLHRPTLVSAPFREMLYDQALLAMAYTEAYQLTKDAWSRWWRADTRNMSYAT